MAAAGRSLTFAATHALSLTFFPGWLRGLESGPISNTEPAAIRLLSDRMPAGEEALLQGHTSFLLCHGPAAVATRIIAARCSHLNMADKAHVPGRSPDRSGQ